MKKIPDWNVVLAKLKQSVLGKKKNIAFFMEIIIVSIW